MSVALLVLKLTIGATNLWPNLIFVMYFIAAQPIKYRRLIASNTPFELI